MNRIKNILRHYPMRHTMNRTIVFSLLFIFLSASPGWGATYYVKSGGNDSLNGLSDANAWATIAKVKAAVTSGDTVYFRSQDTWTSATLPTLTTTAGVTYDGKTYGSGTRATITTTQDNNHLGIVQIPTNNVTFKGFTIDGADHITNGINMCLYCDTNVDSVAIDDCIVHHIGGTNAIGTSTQDFTKAGRGIYVGSMGAYTISNITITNTTVYNINYGGIVIYPTWHDWEGTCKVDTILVRNCTSYNTGLAGDGWGYGIYVKDDVDNAIIEYNNIYSNDYGILVDNVVDRHTGVIGNLTIRYNIVHDNKDSGLDIDSKGRIITVDVYGNIFYDNGKYPVDRGSNIKINRGDQSTSVYKMYNNTFYVGSGTTSITSSHAILLGDGQPDLNTGLGGTPTVDVYNNVIYSSKANAVPIRDVDSKMTGHGNNLIYNAISSTSPHVNIGTTTYDRNGGALDLVQHWDATAQKTDPLFTGGTLPSGFTGTYGVDMEPNTNYFRVTSGAALNNGATLGSPYDGSINGAGRATPIKRPQGSAYDIGAYEYFGTIELTAPTGLTIQYSQ